MKNYICATWADKTIRPCMKLNAFIDQTYIKYGLDRTEFPFQATSVHTRMKRNRLHVLQTGQVSPAWQVEPRIVMFIKLSTECNQEMTREEIISFANSYIKGSEVEQEIIKWKLTHHVGWSDYVKKHGSLPQRAELGIKWFEGFMKRNKQYVKYTPSTNVAYTRKDHCTYEAFNDMYRNIYNLLEQDGYAEKMVEPKFFDMRRR